MKSRLFIYSIFVSLIIVSCQKSEGSGNPLQPPEASGEIQLTFIDVGSGDATLLQLNDYNILVDGGANGMGNGAIIPYFRSQNIVHINLIIGTHPDKDHLGGLDEVIRALPVDSVWDNGQIVDSKSYEKYSAAIRDNNVTWSVPGKGQVFIMGGAMVKVLNTFSGYNGENNNSIVLKISFGVVDILLTGDIKGKAQEDIVRTYRSELRSEILKIPAHGSSDFDPDFADAVQPLYAVISGGKDDIDDGVLSAYKNIAAAVYRTDVHGNITFSTDGENITVRTEKPEVEL